MSDRERRLEHERRNDGYVHLAREIGELNGKISALQEMLKTAPHECPLGKDVLALKLAAAKRGGFFAAWGAGAMLFITIVLKPLIGLLVSWVKFQMEQSTP
ncbi:MAG: hypothetical protein ACYST6_10240 [Planctomycetota bacterium]|jgi:hypothetical protein